MKRPLDITTKDIYKLFRKEHPEVKITLAQYKDIISNIGETFIKKVISNPDGVAFPSNRTFLFIAKRKLPIIKRTWVENQKDIKGFYFPKNWVECKVNNKVVKSFNDHSDGYKFKWTWHKKNSLLKHNSLVAIDVVRNWDRYLAKSIFAGNQNYYNYKHKI